MTAIAVICGTEYLGVLRHTDIPETARLVGDAVRVFGEMPATLRSLATCGSLPECLRDH